MQKKLVEALTTHYYLLHEDGTHFTPLAQVCSNISIIMCPLWSTGFQRLLRQDVKWSLIFNMSWSVAIASKPVLLAMTSEKDKGKLGGMCRCGN